MADRVRMLGTPHASAGTVTMMVAASDASGATKAKADIICHGGADDVEIQEAIGTLPTGGGKVVLSEGTFTIAATIVVPGDTILEGAGMWATKLLAVNSLDAYVVATTLLDATSNSWRIQFLNFRIDGNKANQASGGGIQAYGLIRGLFENLWINDCKEDAIFLDKSDGASGFAGYSSLFRFCTITTNDGNGINLDAQEFAYINFCNIDLNATRGIWCQSTVAEIVGNIIGDNKDGIGIGNSGIKIIGNFFELQDERSIILPGGNPRAIITGNDFHTCSQSSSGTFEHLLVAGEDSIITHNTFEGDSGAAEFAVEEVSGANNNIIAENQFLGSYGTAALLKVGVGTKVHNNIGHTASGELVTITKVMDHAAIDDTVGGASAFFDFADTIPADSIIKSVRCDFTEAWNSDETSTLTMMIGIPTDLDDFSKTSTPGFDIHDAAGVDTFWSESSCQDPLVVAAVVPRVTFTEDSDATSIKSGTNAAGGVTITITYMKA